MKQSILLTLSLHQPIDQDELVTTLAELEKVRDGVRKALPKGLGHGIGPELRNSAMPGGSLTNVIGSPSTP